MDKSRVLAVVTVVLIGVVGYAAYQTARLWAQEEIRSVEEEARAVRAQRDSILIANEVRDSIGAELDAVADSLGAETDFLRARVEEMEAERAEQQLAVWQLRTADDTEREFAQVYPEFAPAMRATELVTDDGDSIRYIMLPTNFARSFMVFRQNSDAFEAQRDSLLVLDEKNVQIIELQDSIQVLTAANADALRIGYDSAFARYEERTEEYIRLLDQPRFRFDVPTVTGLLGATAVGIVLGVTLSN